MTETPFAFTPAERVALETIRDERPEILVALAERLVPALEELSQTCQGCIVSEFDAEDLLHRLRHEFVGRMMVEMDPWGEDEGLRETVLDLLARHLLAEARDGFVKQLIGAKFN